MCDLKQGPRSTERFRRTTEPVASVKTAELKYSPHTLIRPGCPREIGLEMKTMNVKHLVIPESRKMRKKDHSVTMAESFEQDS